jgi:hypothetical protein
VTIVVNLVVTLGMLVVVPLGLRLIGSLPAWTARVWIAGGIPGSVSLWLPRGPVAAGLAAVYASMTFGLATQAPLRLWHRRGVAAREVALLTALVTPSVAGSALVAERYGYHLLGFKLETLALTVAHFHFAGFTAALVAGLVCAATGDRPLGRVAALCVPGGTAIVFVGFFTGDEVELAGAIVLTVGMWLVAWLTWREVRPTVADRNTRLLLGVAAGILVATMLLALDWAAGEAFDLPHLPLVWMAATHGIANAVGFGLCAILAWRRIR